MSEQYEIKLITAEVTKLSLQPNDVLAVKITSDEIEPGHLRSLNDQLKILFPNNKIMLYMVPPDSDLDMTVISAPNLGTNAPSLGTCAEPMSYCNDCACGKKERILSSSEYDIAGSVEDIINETKE